MRAGESHARGKPEPRHDAVSVGAAARPARRHGIQDYRLGEELLLYVPEGETAHALNPSASAIWGLCDGKRSVEEISQEIGRCVGLSGDALLPDILQGVAHLHQLGLLEPR